MPTETPTAVPFPTAPISPTVQLLLSGGGNAADYLYVTILGAAVIFVFVLGVVQWLVVPLGRKTAA